MYINFCHSTTKTHNPQSAGGGGSIMPWGHLSVVHQVKAPLPLRLVKTHTYLEISFMWTWNNSDFVAQSLEMHSIHCKEWPEVFSNESERLLSVPEGSAFASSWIYVTLVFVFIAGKNPGGKNSGNEACYFVHSFPFLEPQISLFLPI